ncbi:hypothetical protein CR162_02735 [Pseudoroseomonas rhizosphaerae]|uniref:Uncharacterized protein n=1 Tax=Teichococcus rhizosphaerae TaxID=1335062 RepID=A0A2C7AFM9_9PROT|nr:hypothetical protein [Pseudoroseomonas rhizosphaerae]PHK96275.1 hypothetical protein CR162_02735 [Pseudoroseomonas rhizosphaerae]
MPPGVTPRPGRPEDAPRRAAIHRAAREAAGEPPGPRVGLFRIARNHAARAFCARHGFRPVAASDGAGTEEGEPGLLLRRPEGRRRRRNRPPFQAPPPCQEPPRKERHP